MADGIKHGAAYIFQLKNPLCLAENPSAFSCTANAQSESFDVTVGDEYWIDSGGPDTYMGGWNYRGFRNGNILGTPRGSISNKFNEGREIYQLAVGNPNTSTADPSGRAKLELVGNYSKAAIVSVCFSSIGKYLSVDAVHEVRQVGTFTITSWHWPVSKDIINTSNWSYSKANVVVIEDAI